MLNEIGLKHGTDKATHHKYLDFYEKNLPDRSFSGRLLEVGVMDGASLRMWADYYPNAEIVGIDIDEPRDSGFSNAKWLKVDGTTPAITQLGKFDIILDESNRPQLLPHPPAHNGELEPNGEFHAQTMREIKDGTRSIRCDYLL